MGLLFSPPPQPLALEHLTAALLFIIPALVKICYGLIWYKLCKTETSGYRKTVQGFFYSSPHQLLNQFVSMFVFIFAQIRFKETNYRDVL